MACAGFLSGASCLRACLLAVVIYGSLVFAAQPAMGAISLLGSAFGSYSSTEVIGLVQGTWTGCGSSGTTIPITSSFRFVGLGPGQTVLQCGSSTRAFALGTTGTGTTTFENITFSGGSINGGCGGMLNWAGASGGLVLKNVIFTQNSAANTGYGGHVYVKGTLNVLNAVFRDGSAKGYGGSIYLDSGSTASISNATFIAGTVSIGSGGYGGHLYAYKSTSLTIGNSSFIQGRAAMDGASLYIDEVPNGASITSSTFLQNSAARYGGGPVLYQTAGTITFDACTFSQNSGTYGGAVYSDTSTSSVTRSSFTANTATSGGGAFYQNRGTASISGSFSTNSAPYGGAFYSNSATASSIQSATFISNSAATSGGGFYADTTTTISIINATFSSHSVGTSGGAMYLNKGSTTISGSTLAANSANNGGAIYSNSVTAISVLNSAMSSNQAGTSGGAIYYNKGTSATIATATLTANFAASYGGAVYSTQTTTVVMSGVAFGSNSVAYYGGGFYADEVGTMQLQNASFTKNRAQDGGGSFGVCAVTSLSISGTTFNNATAKFAAHGYIVDTQTFISNSTFANGLATGNYYKIYTGDISPWAMSLYPSSDVGDFESGGGALFVQDEGGTPVQPMKLNISGSTFINCVSAYAGGAIMVIQASVSVVGTTFNANTGFWGGGAIFQLLGYTNKERFWADNVTASNNVAQGFGGAFWIVEPLWYGSSEAGYAVPVSITNSMFRNNTCSPLGKVDYYRTSNFFSSSKAWYSFDPADSIPTSFQLDDYSVWGSGGAVYIGHHPTTFTNVQFIDNQAHVLGGGLYLCGTPSTKWTDVKFINNRILYEHTITAQPADSSSSSSSSSSPSYGFQTYGGGAVIVDTPAVMTRVTCDRNKGGSGGCIYGYESDINITASVFTRNLATNWYGGAIYGDEFGCGSVTLTDSYFADNANLGCGGGGVMVDSPLYQTTWRNVTFVRNSASTVTPIRGYGGGVYIYAWRGAAGGTVDFVNCVFDNNTAFAGGGLSVAMEANYYWTVGAYRGSIINSTIRNNVSPGFYGVNYAKGGGIHIEGSAIRLYFNISGTTFSGNSAGVRWVPGVGGKNQALLKGFGSAISHYYLATLVVEDTVFANNYCSIEGTIALAADSGTAAVPIIYLNRVLFANNTVDGGASALHLDFQSCATVVNSNFISNTAYNRNNAQTADPSLGSVVGVGPGSYIEISKSSFLRNRVPIVNSNLPPIRQCPTFGTIGIYGNRNDPAFADLRDLTIRENQISGSGGGVAVRQFSYVALNNITIESNSVTDNGGGIYYSGEGSTITEFENIHINSNSAKYGGGLYYGAWKYDDVSSTTQSDGLSTTASTSALPSTSTYTSSYSSLAPVGANNFTTGRLNLMYNYASNDGGGFYVAGNLWWNSATVVGNSAGGSGGGLYASICGTALLDNIDFINNQARDGGAVAVYGDKLARTITIYGIVEMTNVNITGGMATETGGAISIGSYGLLTGNHINITKNSATNGGALYMEDTGALDLSLTTLAQNSAQRGGMLYSTGGAQVTMRDVRATDHVATAGGGAVYASASTLTFTRTQFIKSRSPNNQGGAISLNSARATLTDSLITGSTAVQGAAIYALLDCTVNATNTMFISNTATQYGGAISATLQSTVNIRGGTISGSAAATGGAIYAASSTNVMLDQTTFTNNFASSDGGALYMVGIASSQLLDITASTFSGQSATRTGGAISVNGASTIQISGSTFTDTSSGDEGGALYTSGVSSVKIQASTFVRNTAASGGAMSLRETGVFNITSTTMTNTTAVGVRGTVTRGGAIACRGAAANALNLKDVTLTGARASTGTGGGLDSDGCQVTMTRGHVMGCAAMSGGGVRAVPDVSVDGASEYMAIQDSVFDGNTALTGAGGGIWTPRGTVAIDDSTLSNNVAATYGGAMFLDTPAARGNTTKVNLINGCSFTGNAAGVGGGLFFNDLYDIATALLPVVGANVFGVTSAGAAAAPNSVAADGYGADVASTAAQLAWIDAPRGSLQSGDPIGPFNNESSQNAVVVEMNDAFGQLVTRGADGLLLKIGLLEDSTVALLLGPALAPLNGQSVTFAGIIFLSSTPGPYTIVVAVSGASNQITPLQAAVLNTPCREGYSLIDRGLAFQICQAPDCSPGTFGTPGNCHECAAGTANAFSGQVQCLGCPADQWSDEGATVCDQCPLWATCSGGTPLRRAGWWSDETGNAYKCESTAACPGGNVSLNTCAAGYTGFLCGKCVSTDTETYGRQFGDCLQCWSRSASVAVAFLYALVIVGAIVFLVYKSDGVRDSDPSAVLAKIILSYLQMLNIISNFATFEGSPLPTISVFTQAATPTATVLPVSCAVGYTFYTLLYFTLFAPIAAVMVAALFWAIFGLIKGKRGHAYDRFICSAVVVLLIAYPTVTSTSLTVFDCRASSDTGRLRADLEVICYQGAHVTAAIFGALGVLFYGIGVPLWAYVILSKNKDNLHEMHNRKRYNFLFDGFRTGMASWSVVVILRKSFLVALQVFAHTSPSIQVAVGVLLLTTYTVSHAKLLPYNVDHLNRAEMAGLFTMFVVLVGGIPTILRLHGGRLRHLCVAGGRGGSGGARGAGHDVAAGPHGLPDGRHQPRVDHEQHGDGQPGCP